MEATFDSVGRLVVPKALRDALGIGPGSTVDISSQRAGLQIVPLSRTARIVADGSRLVAESDTEIDDDIVFGPDRRRAQVSLLALDASVAVPLLMRAHRSHPSVSKALQGFSVCLTAQSLTETHSVLTRLPGDARVSGADAAALMESNFATAVLLSPQAMSSLPRTLSTLGIVGGAVSDALVGLAAKAAGLELATRDARALGTYGAVGVQVRIVG